MQTNAHTKQMNYIYIYVYTVHVRKHKATQKLKLIQQTITNHAH